MGGSPDSGIVVELPLQSEDMKYETIIADPEHEVNIALPPPDAVPAGAMPFHANYVDLVQRCWAQAAASRPPMAAVVRELRRMAAALRGDSAVAAALMAEGRGAAAPAPGIWKM
jgi:hypothetical protein